MMLVIAMKLIGAPLLVGGASLAGKRYGPALAGLLSGLPVIAGPIIAVLWLEQGAAYAARVAWMLPVGLAPLAAYLWIFSRLAPRCHWLICLLAGWLAFLLAAAACHALDLPYALLAGGATLAMLVAGFTLPRQATLFAPASATLPQAELLARIVAAFALVFGLTSASARLGAEWTGLLAAFPVAGSIMPAFTLAKSGPAATLRLLRGFVSGLLGLAGFAICLALLLPSWGATAFIPAVFLSLGIAWFNARVVFRP
ncbi:MAG: hypothetical protein H6R07_1031 [Proteobacteria bacterium]|nr:hypothetical protein [Pseudomonadota bacterium]